MNPWKQTVLFLLRDILRFALWFCLVVCGLMVGLFAITFSYEFLRHLWSWCRRVLFTGGW